MKAVAAVVMAAGLAATGCGYHVSGRADMVPKTIETICVPAFSNVTTRYRLTDRLAEAVAREFISRTRFKIVNDPTQADAVLNGTVINYFAFPVIYDPTLARASTFEMNITMSASLVERATGKAIFTRPTFSMKQQYQVAADARSFLDESDVALDRLSRDVARMLVSAILENF